MIREALSEVVSGRDLPAAVMDRVMAEILDGEAPAELVAALAVALRMKGETTTELTAAARALRSRCDALRPRVSIVVDNCGTGGDSAGTFNLSTVASFVIAACGATVAKHGNRAVSSRAGSADVLEALGVNIEASREVVDRCLHDVGIAFLMAPRFHGALRHAAPVRRALGIRTFFNLLGPLVNPACATHQLVGVFDARWVEPMAHVLRELGGARGWVVHGDDGLDEVSPFTTTTVAEFDEAGVRRRTVAPSDFGLEPVALDRLRGGDARTNAAIARGVLGGDSAQAAPRTAVILNAAAALCATGLEVDPRAAAAQARDAVESGRALAKLDALIEASRP
ncbi:MAG: anthranilate phosphoribosyltransferase [Deltaproteobacteria bacterium]|nr:anthranilate phosphoribosyltransferase [Deltaproteobacteria bacterium]